MIDSGLDVVRPLASNSVITICMQISEKFLKSASNSYEIK